MKFGLEKGDVLMARVRGDGREYSVNLYVPRPLIAFSYRATVKTKKDEWIEVKLPLDLLSQLWDASPNDGFVVADYSTALRAAGRVTDANAVLNRGFSEVPRQAKGRRPLLEAEAEILEREERFTDAFAVHRELVNSWPTYLHLHRRYASCLLAAAAHFKAARDSAREDSAVNEAKAVLTKLLQIAPLDKWAADALHSAEVRSY